MHGTHADTMYRSLLVPVEFQGAKNLRYQQFFLAKDSFQTTCGTLRQELETPRNSLGVSVFVRRPPQKSRTLNDAYSDLMATGADCAIGTRYHYQYSSLMQESKSS